MPDGGWERKRLHPDTLRVVNENYQDIFRFVYRMTGHREAAEDIVQEAFLRLASEKGKTLSGTDARKWLFVVSRNLCISRIRKTVAQPQVSMDAAGELQSHMTDPSGQLAKGERDIMVQKAVLELPQNCAKPLSCVNSKK